MRKTPSGIQDAAVGGDVTIIDRAIIVVFAIIALGVSIWAIVAIVRQGGLRRKALWIVVSLIGTIGLGINWSRPDDIILLIGVTIPPVIVFKLLPAGPVIVKTGFPIGAIAALFKIHGR